MGSGDRDSEGRGLERAGELLERARAWGEARDDVRGIVLIGSQSRTSRPADRWSDVDLLISCREPGSLLDTTGWLEELGEPRISFLESNPVDGNLERRVLFANGLDVDVNTIRSRDVRLLLLALGRTRLLVPPSKRREARAGARALATVFRPGYRVILDKDGVLERMAELVLRQPPPPHHEGRLEEIAADFWYHAVWTAKKLRRGEMWMAKTCLDGYLKDRVLDAVFLGRERPGGMEPKRLVDETLDPETVSLLSKSYAGYDRPSIERALAATLDLFAHVERQTAERLGVTLDESVEEFARAEVARVLAG